jgi:hypothetical protein
VTCWGANELGQKDAPEGAFAQIAAGGNHTCGVRPDGRLECWGGDTSWQSHPRPEGTFVEVACHVIMNCAVNTDGETLCWGPDTRASLPAPRYLRGLSVGAVYTCGLDAAGDAGCWGSLEATRWWRDPFRAITAPEMACGLKRDGTVVCGFGWMVNRDNRL